MDRPQRKYRLIIEIQADTPEDLKADLNHIIFYVFTERQCTPPINSVMGGYSQGHTADLEVNESMTHDQYAEDLKAYLAVINKKSNA